MDVGTGSLIDFKRASHQTRNAGRGVGPPPFSSSVSHSVLQRPGNAAQPASTSVQSPLSEQKLLEQDHKKLFDCVLVVGINTRVSSKVQNAPFVKYHFPYPPSFMKSVTQFCFPDTSADMIGNMKKEETFSFVLTEANGEKRWGYCIRVFPQCFCIVSFIPCFSIFSKILRKVIALNKASTTGTPFGTCTVFLKAIYEQPLPHPGGTLQFSIEYPSTKKSKIEQYQFKRPDDSDSLLDHVNFHPLLSCLSTENILATFASLLVERRIIFISDRLSTLSASVQAAVALLYPFSWQHVYIPVLPAPLLTFCCAPMPFVVGILRTSVQELKKLSQAMEEVVIVDLDDNRVMPLASVNDLELLPPFVQPLRTTIEAISKSSRSPRMTIKGLKKAKALSAEEKSTLANGFIGFMIDLLASYRNFLIRDKPARGIGFNSEAFLQNVAPETRPLLKLITETQMFQVFIEQRGSRLNNGAFDKELNLKEPSQPGVESSTAVSDEHNTTVMPERKLRPAQSRFTMYEYGTIKRSEISAVHKMLEEDEEKSKKEIEEEESLKLLRQWRAEEKERKNIPILSSSERTIAPRKQSIAERIGRPPPPPPTVVNRQARSCTFSEIRSARYSRRPIPLGPLPPLPSQPLRPTTDDSQPVEPNPTPPTEEKEDTSASAAAVHSEQEDQSNPTSN